MRKAAHKKEKMVLLDEVVKHITFNPETTKDFIKAKKKEIREEK